MAAPVYVNYDHLNQVYSSAQSANSRIQAVYKALMDRYLSVEFKGDAAVASQDALYGRLKRGYDIMQANSVQFGTAVQKFAGNVGSTDAAYAARLRAI